MDRAIQAFGSGSTVQLDLEKLEGPSRGQWLGRGRLPVCRVEPNFALEAFRQRIERPTTIEDPRLGRLTLTPGTIIAAYNDQQMADTYDGQVRLGGQPCGLSIDLTRGSRAHTKAARGGDRRRIAKAAALVVRFDKRLVKILGEVASRSSPDLRQGLARRSPGPHGRLLTPAARAFVLVGLDQRGSTPHSQGREHLRRSGRRSPVRQSWDALEDLARQKEMRLLRRICGRATVTRVAEVRFRTSCSSRNRHVLTENSSPRQFFLWRTAS